VQSQNSERTKVTPAMVKTFTRHVGGVGKRGGLGKVVERLGVGFWATREPQKKNIRVNQQNQKEQKKGWGSPPVQVPKMGTMGVHFATDSQEGKPTRTWERAQLQSKRPVSNKQKASSKCSEKAFIRLNYKERTRGRKTERHRRPANSGANYFPKDERGVRT